jgi:hypothetical protein
MKEFVVFYAWQSDTPAKCNRRLIRQALELAAKNISSDPKFSIQVRIDSDTQGVLGHVPVIDTMRYATLLSLISPLFLRPAAVS